VSKESDLVFIQSLVDKKTDLVPGYFYCSQCFPAHAYLDTNPIYQSVPTTYQLWNFSTGFSQVMNISAPNYNYILYLL